MARPRKYVHNADGRTVDGVSYHQRGGFYIIRPDDQERDYFGKEPGALEEAKRRYDELNGFPKYQPPRMADEVRSDLRNYFDAFEEDDSVLEKKPDVIERLMWTESATEAMNLMIDLGVDADWLKDDPDFLAKYANNTRTLDPEWAERNGNGRASTRRPRPDGRPSGNGRPQKNARPDRPVRKTVRQKT